jgi:hypothetical protein
VKSDSNPEDTGEDGRDRRSAQQKRKQLENDVFDGPTQPLQQSVCLFKMAAFENTGHPLIFSNQRLVALVPWSAGKNDFGSRAANSGLICSNKQSNCCTSP